MGILTIIFFFILASIGVWLLFKILKWGFRKKARIIWLLALLVGVMASIATYKLLFIKMEFVQSNIYPDLYLIKNPVKERDVVNKAIKEKVMQTIKTASKNSKSQTVRFYEYSKGDWGENGTAYFIDHKERPDGMTAELLEYYPEYLLAKFSFQSCKKDNVNCFGKLDYYNDRKRIKTDTLFNSCKK